MWRNSDVCTRNACGSNATRFYQRRELIYRADEAALPRSWWSAAEVGMGIEHRKQCETYAGTCRSRGNSFRQLAGIIVGYAGWRVVQVVEFSRAGKSPLQHLRISKRSDRLDLIGIESIEETVHHLTPRPEIVAGGSAHFSQPCHASLEPMTVHIAQAGYGNRVPLVIGVGLDTCFHPPNRPASEMQPHALYPTPRQQCGLKPERHGQIL